MINQDQRRSDYKFYTAQLQTRAAKVLGLDPDNTSWFEIVGELENTITQLEAKISDVSQQAYEEGLMDGQNQ